MPIDPITENAPPGTIEATDEGGLIRFERRYPHPVDTVWGAITRPERLAQWWLPFDAEIELELVPGGRFEMRGTGDEPFSMTCTVLAVEPPTLFEHTHADPGSVIRWELQAEGEATLLVVTHSVPSVEGAAEKHYVAGLHTSLERLGPALDGRPVPWSWPRFEELRDEYAAARES